MSRVVVTGIGAVSPLGNSFHDSWEAAKAGISGLMTITRFDVSTVPWKVAGELKGFDARKYLSQKELNRLDPFVLYAVAASVMAIEDAGLLQKSGIRNEIKIKKDSRSWLHDYLTSGGVIIGSSRGGISTIERELQKKIFVTHHSSIITCFCLPYAINNN